jgi:hypothetical protein
MKLRASYGTLGNDQILIMVMFLNFLVKLLMFLMVLWLTEQQTVKYQIKFEVGTSAKFDLGLDLKLFNNKVSIVTVISRIQERIY